MTGTPRPGTPSPVGNRVPPLASPVILLIRGYRRWVSPGLAPRCRFYPSCSEYALEALRTRGLVVGTALMVWRLLRCAPWHPGGYDPVPPRRHRVGRRADSRAEARATEERTTC
jgi:putative membrane protein insertion efficiency factor